MQVNHFQNVRAVFFLVCYVGNETIISLLKYLILNVEAACWHLASASYFLLVYSNGDGLYHPMLEFCNLKIFF